MADVVKQGAGFEFDAGLGGEMMQRLQGVEEHDAEFADVLGVALVIFEAAAEAACADEHLAGFDGVAVRLLAGKGFAGDFLDDAFADADGRNEELADIEITAEDNEDDGGDAHDVSAITTDAVGFHALANIALEDVGKAVAKQRNIECRKAFAARAGSDVGKSFGVATEGDGELIDQIGAIGNAGFEKGAEIAANLFGLDRANGAGDAERGHQANRADGKLSAVENGVVAEKIDFEAAAAEINDAVGRRFRTESGDGGFPAEARFFLCGDDFEAKTGGLLDAVNKRAAVTGFAGGAGGDGAIFGDAVFLHEFVEMTEGFDAFL